MGMGGGEGGEIAVHYFSVVLEYPRRKEGDGMEYGAGWTSSRLDKVVTKTIWATEAR